MGKKHSKELRTFLLDLGFTEARRTKLGGTVYRHPEYPRNVTVTETIPDANAGHLIENISKYFGIETKQRQSKRDAQKVKERHAGDRARAAEQLARSKKELSDYQAQLDSRLDGLGRALTAGQIERIEAKIEENEVDILYWSSLMMRTEGARPHAGARHRS